MNNFAITRRLLLTLSLCAIMSPAQNATNTTIAQTTARREGAGSSSSTLQLAGLRAKVTVRRDERAIPYIEATNDEDMYFAQGFVTASDRLWQMDLFRRTARGELAEIFGRAALEEDKRHRIYGFAGISEQMLAKSSAPVRAALMAYARGVNAYINSLDQKSLPPEFQILQYRPRPWTPADSLVIGKILSETLSTSWPTDLMRAFLADLPAEKRDMLLPETSALDVIVVGSDELKRKASIAPEQLDAANFKIKNRDKALHDLAGIEATIRRSLERIGLYTEDRAASNNWVVTGAHTVSGKPLLANDPHLPASAPSIWYMVHLSSPAVRVAGVTAPGVPGVIIGHNQSIAWGVTNLEPDVQDLYLEKFDPQNPRRYLTPAGWREAILRHEEIKVRKGLVDASTETVPVDVTVTQHGPIVYERDGARFALRWTALDPQTVEFDAFYNLNRARNWNEFRAALKTYSGPTQNFIYADTSGHIGYYGAGLIPIRNTGDGSLPYDGSTDAGEWTRFIPFDDLPHLYDPLSGIIVTANNRVVGRDYPYHLTHEWVTPYRARRIRDLLQAKPKLTVDDLEQIQGDVYSIGGALFARKVRMRIAMMLIGWRRFSYLKVGMGA
jgi:penicillin amidase